MKEAGSVDERVYALRREHRVKLDKLKATHNQEVTEKNEETFCLKLEEKKLAENDKLSAKIKKLKAMQSE